MLLFLLTYLSVYGGMTVYVLLRLNRGLGGPARVWVPVWLGALGMMLLPMLLHRLEGRLEPLAGRCLAGAAWTWLVLVFWALSLLLAAEVWNLMVAILDGLRHGAGALRLPPRAMALGVLALLPLLCAWGWVEGGRVALRTVEIEMPRLAAGTSIRLLQLADMHLGHTSRPRVWAEVLAAIRAAQPDVLVSTGDLVDAPGRFVEAWVRGLADIRPPLGKYAILGNHEFYAEAQRNGVLTDTGGFVVLRGAAAEISPGLVLAGVDDPECVRHDGSGAWDEASGLERVPPGACVVLLKHRPVVTAAARARVSLQLSGHTHAGQVFPFGWVVRMVYPYAHGQTLTFPEGLRLYVSRGTGTWGPPFRLLSPAELTLFVLRGTGPARPDGSARLAEPGSSLPGNGTGTGLYPASG